MAAPTLNLLPATLSSAVIADATGPLAGTGGPSDLTGLFESVLLAALGGSADSAAANNGLLDPNALLASATSTDPLDQLLGLLEQSTTDTDESDSSNPLGVNADLLSQLLATLGANLTPSVAPTTSQPTPATTNAAQLSVTAATIQSTSSTPLGTARVSTNPNPVAVSPNAVPALEPTPRPTTPVATPSTAIPSTINSVTASFAGPGQRQSANDVSVSGATLAAGRTPAVVLQTPISLDPAYRAPALVVPVTAESPQPPVTETSSVKGLPAVALSTGSPVAWNSPEELATSDNQLTPTKAGNTSPAPTTEFAQRLNAVLTNPNPAQPSGRVETVSAVPVFGPPAPSVVQNPAAAVPTAPVAGSATVSEPQSGASSTLRIGVASPTVPQRTANLTEPNPQIAITVAQPISVAPQEFTPAVAANLASLSRVPVNDLPEEPNPEPSVTNLFNAGFGQKPLADLPASLDAAARVSQTAPQVVPQLVSPLVAHLTTRPNTGETEIQIRLDPPELGTVKVKIVSSGGELRAELSVTTEAVRQVVEGQLPELRQKLDDAGVRVQNFTVSTDASGGSAQSDAGSQRQLWRETLPPDSIAPAPRMRLVNPSRPGVGRVDVTA